MVPHLSAVTSAGRPWTNHRSQSATPLPLKQRPPPRSRGPRSFAWGGHWLREWAGRSGAARPRGLDHSWAWTSSAAAAGAWNGPACCARRRRRRASFPFFLSGKKGALALGLCCGAPGAACSVGCGAAAFCSYTRCDVRGPAALGLGSGRGEAGGQIWAASGTGVLDWSCMIWEWSGGIR